MTYSCAAVAQVSVFKLPDVNPSEGLWRPDIQAHYSSVDWQTLDVLCLPAGHYKFILLQNLPDRDRDRPLMITNCEGQVRVGGLGHHYLFVLGGGSHWRLTGRYSSAALTGHPDFIGHAQGNYGASRGRYGILIDDESIEHGGPSGLAIGGGATDFTVDHLEIRRVGFAGMLIKTDNSGDATMRNVRIHDNYVHDVGSEGIYIGSTQPGPQHSIENLKFFNNRVIRTGTEIFQLGQIGGGTEIYNNVFLAGAMDWKNPFQPFQDNAVQLGPRYGNISFRNNIVIGAASAWLNYLGIDIQVDNHSQPATVEIKNNYFSHSRHFGAYVARMTQQNMATRFESNTFRLLRFQMDEVEAGRESFNQFFRLGSGTVENTSRLEFIQNQFDGEEFWVASQDNFNDLPGDVYGEGNSRTSIPELRFQDSGFPDGFDWLRLEIWTETDDKGNPVSYEHGDIVSIDGDLFECQQVAGCAAGMHPNADGNAVLWQALAPPTDDVRLRFDSAFQGVGLLDTGEQIFHDRFESHIAGNL